MDGSALAQLKSQLARLRQERDELQSDVADERNVVAGMEQEL